MTGAGTHGGSSRGARFPRLSSPGTALRPLPRPVPHRCEPKDLPPGSGSLGTGLVTPPLRTCPSPGPPSPGPAPGRAPGSQAPPLSEDHAPPGPRPALSPSHPRTLPAPGGRRTVPGSQSWASPALQHHPPAEREENGEAEREFVPRIAEKEAIEKPIRGTHSQLPFGWPDSQIDAILSQWRLAGGKPLIPCLPRPTPARPSVWKALRHPRVPMHLSPWTWGGGPSSGQRHLEALVPCLVNS